MYPTDLADAVGGGADPDQRGELLLPSRRFLRQKKLFKDYKLNKNAVFCAISVANRLKFRPQSQKKSDTNTRGMTKGRPYFRRKSIIKLCFLALHS
jgi:hypothetical protein